MAERDLVVRVLGDSRDVERAFTRSSRAAGQFGGQMTVVGGKVDKTFASFKNLGGAFAGGLVASAVIDQLRASINVASNLNEQLSRSNVVFGQSASAIDSWAKTTATSMGLARDQALAFAGTFGLLFTNVGQSSEDASRLSQTLVKLGADLASFTNTSVEDALAAIRSGLTGEIEPLRRYGVFLNEARTQTLALAQSGKESVSQLTTGEKVLARYAILLKDTTTAQGDFARTSEGLANKQRALAATSRDLQAKLGTLLIPAMLELVGALNDGATAAILLTEQLSKIGNVRIPTIEIPFTTVEIPGTGGKVFDVAKEFALQVSPLGPARRTKQLVDILFGGDPKPGDVQAAADAFRQKVGGIPLTVEPVVPKTRKIGIPSFGDKGFKPLKPDPVVTGLSERLQQAFLDAQLTTGLTDDLRELGKQRDAIVRALAQPGLQQAQVTGLKSDLVSIVGQIEGINGQITSVADALRERNRLISEAAKEAASKAKTDMFTRLIGNLELGVDRAGLTRKLSDDLDGLVDLRVGLEKQIRAGVEVASAQSALVGVIGRIADTREEIRRRAQTASRTALQAGQFRALGLSASGDELTPAIANLRKQLGSLSDRLGGTAADTSGNRGVLARIRKVLTDPINKATVETRGAIRDMFAAIRSEFDDQARGPLTKTSALSSSKILDGLGLSRDLEKQLRARLSNFNSAGVAIAPRGGSFSTGGGGFGGAPVVVQSHVTVEMDGDVVSRTVTRSQQKTTRRNPRQKRGPNRGT